MLHPFKGKTPIVGKDVFIASNATIIGDVTLGDNVSIFFGAVLRGDILGITVGARTNIQEHALLHTTYKRSPCIVGEEVTIGHRAIVHGCFVGNRVLIGMGAIVLDDAVIEEECLIGAGTLITEGKKIPPRSLVLGSPGKVVRTLEESEIKRLKESAEGYVLSGFSYRESKIGIT